MVCSATKRPLFSNNETLACVARSLVLINDRRLEAIESVVTFGKIRWPAGDSCSSAPSIDPPVERKNPPETADDVVRNSTQPKLTPEPNTSSVRSTLLLEGD